MTLKDLIIDPKSLGRRFWLVDVVPVYEYKDNVRTDNITAYRYVVALPDKGLDKIGVKIEGSPLMEKPDGYAEVTFQGLEINVYMIGGQLNFAAKATGITLVNQKA